jgi:hypothetical protein
MADSRKPEIREALRIVTEILGDVVVVVAFSRRDTLLRNKSNYAKRTSGT